MNNSGTIEIMVFSAITVNASNPRTGAGRKDNMSLRSPKQTSLKTCQIAPQAFSEPLAYGATNRGTLSKEAAHYATTERKLNCEFTGIFVLFGHPEAGNANNLPKSFGRQILSNGSHAVDLRLRTEAINQVDSVFVYLLGGS